jgi:hypothetical protein
VKRTACGLADQAFSVAVEVGRADVGPDAVG